MKILYLIIVLLLGSQIAEAEYQIPELELRHPRNYHQSCYWQQVRINTYLLRTYRNWDGSYFQTRTLIGSRLEWQRICESHRYHILEE